MLLASVIVNFVTGNGKICNYGKLLNLIRKQCKPHITYVLTYTYLSKLQMPEGKIKGLKQQKQEMKT